MDDIRNLRKIGLAKLFLWSEAERIQTYPEAFVNLTSDRTYTKQTLATDVFDLVYAQHNNSRPIRGDQINNLFGMYQKSEEKLVIRGINLFKGINGGVYEATDEALKIGRAYKANKNNDIWAVLLAHQIAKYEVRTRFILYLIGAGGWKMEFPDTEFFSNPSVNTVLEKEGETIQIFGENGITFNQVLLEHRHVALGPWWKAEIESFGFIIHDDFIFEGIREGPPATNYINSNIKPGLFLMKYLGLIVQKSGGWVLSGKDAERTLGAAIAENFIDTNQSFPQRPPLEILIEAATALQDDEGYVIIGRLAREWAVGMHIPAYNAAQELDEFIRKQLYEESVKILARHQGQPRHGRGLFGDDQARKVKFSFSSNKQEVGGVR